MKNKIVSREKWLKARKALLRKEKDFTRKRDALARERLKLPWVRVDEDYAFETPTGRKTLAGLFGKNSQLVVYHFMLPADWKAGCPGCTFMADHLERAEVHLRNHDVSLTMVSRAPLKKLNAYKKRMGWTLPWVSSGDGRFNFDYHVSFTPEQLASGAIDYNYERNEEAARHGSAELHGTSAFYKDAKGRVFHTYSTYARGADPFLTVYQVLDIAPLGRNERGPDGKLRHWMRRRDEY
jgi:predicted dithiol-disulfide oxidoreductase (DUF899 family)